MALTFVWDPQKAASNPEKHGVSFEEATTASADPLSLTIPDPDHSESEERFVLVGHSNLARPLVVVPAETGGTLRNTIARMASALERGV